ncbi:MAG: hypothetical protein LQ340_004323 [Diploschistes diacapsis]|nr:MAG: hypothetical protein LQ340_004323 [Diploschistes diacapsis]
MPTTRSRNSIGSAKLKEEANQPPEPTSTAKTNRSKSKNNVKAELPEPTRKRKRGAQDSPQKEVKTEDTKTEDTDIESPRKRSSKSSSSASKKKTRNPSNADLEAGSKMAAGFVANRNAQRAKLDPAKKNLYGFSPGQSPYPGYDHPTPAECKEVCDILSKAHGKVQKPKTIPQPSLNNSGCGEVPSVLDALIRTRLSAATNNQNSSRAFRGLVEKFGIIQEGVGKGSVDWDAVRRADVKLVFEAIKTGGLADVKSRHIKQILQMVYDENQARKEKLESGQAGGQEDAIKEEEGERKAEVTKAASNILSLDHLHLLDNDTAFNKLLEYPGIGPKTASCVLLFCMQRPSFAVDTHVFRLTKWLGWVPSDQKARTLAKALAKEQGGKPKRMGAVTRESAYAHLDVRIPDDLKYPLHYLLIKHGRNCGWCSAKMGKDAKVGVCPLSKLMSSKGRAKGTAKKWDAEDDGEVEGADDEDTGEREGEVGSEEGIHNL